MAEKLASIYEAMRHLMDEVVFVHDEARNITFVSPSVEHVLGYTEEAFTRLQTHKLIHPDDMPTAFAQALELRAEDGQSYRSTLRVKHADGHYVWCEIVGRNLLHTEIGGVVSTLRDISERRALEEALLHQANHDELSGLPNRRKFLGELQKALAATPPLHLGLLMIDLDNFKPVNDTLGHMAGDELLLCIANNIRHALRPGDLAARVGGDEFAVLCQRVDGAEVLLSIAERVREKASGYYPLDQGPATIGLSIGAAIAKGGDEPLVLMSIADDALYRAKGRGGGRVILAARQGSGA